MTREQRLFAIAWRERSCFYRTIRRVGVAPRDFEDVVQNVLTDAWRLISTGHLVLGPGRDERLAIRGWLPYVARIAALKFKQTRGLGMPIGEPLDHDVAGDDPIARLEARDALRVALYRVNRVEREVLARTAQGDQLAEIGDAIGIPAGTVATTLRRVRRILVKRREK